MIFGVDPYLILPLISLCFVLIFGGLSLLRHEGLSTQFALEVLILTGLALLLSWGRRVIINPIFFLIFVYLVSMRARLLVDVANPLSTRGKHQIAEPILRLALRLRPDAVTRLIVLINYGVTYLRQGRFKEAIKVLEEVLSAKPLGTLGPKHEAACRYNLGLAYLQAGEERKAVGEFNEVIDLMPDSLYAVGARTALRKRKEAKIPAGPSQKENG
ncbi:MAG TPA: hypothetical protein DCP08_03055 [Chloroflexi bacterium]|nr:hypothetical protein [Chloroflexota bacterium]